MRHGRLGLRVFCAAVALLACAPAGASAADWTVGVIQGPAGTTRISPTAVNAGNVVVGIARFPGESEDTAFRWEDGVMIKLDTAGFGRVVARDINDAGVIVGFGVGPDPRGNGIVWTATQTTSSGVRTAFNLYGGAGKDDMGSDASGINNKGVIVGRAGVRWESPVWGPSYNHLPAFGTGGGWTGIEIPAIVNGSSTQRFGGNALAINDDGVILGTGGPGADKAWLSTGGAPAPQLDLYPGAHGLNIHGHVAGRSTSSSTNHLARVWDGSSYQAIGALQAKSAANAINDSGWAVGRAGAESYQSELTAGNAYLWRPDEAPAPLYTLAGTGWSMYSAADITNDGLIVGTGRYGGQSVGFWMAPANLAHIVSGTVYGPGGAAAPGARVKALGAGGGEVGAAVTDAAGRYSMTLPRANGYAISVEPDGVYAPDALAGCNELLGTVCKLNLVRNRTLDFYDTRIVVPALPPGDSRGPGGGAPPSPAPPVARLAGRSSAVTPTAKGAVSFALAPFAADTSGTVVLKTAGKVKAARVTGKPRVLTLGRARFSAKAGKTVTLKLKLSAQARKLVKRGSVKTVVTVTARNAMGTSTTTFRLTVKRAKR